jgi:hypothetical protein
MLVVAEWFSSGGIMKDGREVSSFTKRSIVLNGRKRQSKPKNQ